MTIDHHFPYWNLPLTVGYIRYTPSSDVGDVQPAMNSWPSQEFLAGDTAPAPSPFSSHLWSVRRQKWTYDLLNTSISEGAELSPKKNDLPYWPHLAISVWPCGAQGSICKAATIVKRGFKPPICLRWQNQGGLVVSVYVWNYCRWTKYSNPATPSVLNPDPQNLNISMRMLAKVTLGVWLFRPLELKHSVHINIELWGRGGCTRWKRLEYFVHNPEKHGVSSASSSK